MKILYLITKSEAGGAQTHLADLCRYFKNSGHEVFVMSEGEGWLKKECEKIGVNFLNNRFFSNKPYPRRLFFAIGEIKKCVKEIKPDIVHCHSSAAAVLGRLAIRGKVKTVYTAHGWGFNLGMSFWVKYPVLLLEKLCACYTDKYICVAEFVKKLALKYHLAKEDKFEVIYNGVSIAENKPEEKEKTNEIRLLFVGRLAEPKRPEMAMEAISSLLLAIKEKIIFTIIGDGPKRSDLESLARDKRIKTEFLGNLPREEVVLKMQKADIFVFISAWEGFPYTILEAMAVGLPVIASDVGGVKEMVGSENGILLNNTVAEIREAILKLADNENLRLRLGEEGKRQIREKFSLDEMLKKVENVYRKL